MPHSTRSASDSKKRSRLPALLVGLPFLLLLCAGGLYIYNNRAAALEIPTPAMPPDNAYDDFVKAAHLAKAMQHKSPYSLPGLPEQRFTLANYAAAEKDAQPALAQMRPGLNKPYQSPIDRSLNGSKFAEFAGMRELARTMSGVATYQEATGHFGPALQTRLDAMELSVMIPHGGGILPMLVGNACESIADSRMERLLPQLSPQELALAAERMEKIEAKRTPYADIEMEEGYSVAAHHLELVRTQKVGSFQSVSKLIQVAPGAELTWKERMEIASFLYGDKTGMLRANLDCFKARAEEARKPYTGHTAVKIPENLFAHMGLGEEDFARKRELHTETIARILQTEVALYRFKAAQGRFPGALNALTPLYLKAVPDDLFGGGAGIPLHYQAKEGGGGFLLYSLGDDLKDDGGQPQQPMSINLKGDMAAGQLFPGRSNSDLPARQH